MAEQRGSSSGVVATGWVVVASVGGVVGRGVVSGVWAVAGGGVVDAAAVVAGAAVVLAEVGGHV